MQIMTDKKISFLGFNGKFPLLISNLVYGEPYTSIFINFHLPSLVEELLNSKNAIDIKYLLFTDKQSMELIKRSTHYRELTDFVPYRIMTLEGDKDYGKRYALQGLQLNYSAKIALEESRVVHQSSADVYYGKGYFDAVISKFLSDDSDAIFFENFRCAYESVAHHLYNKKTLNTDQLFDIGISNLHPLWVAAHWDAPFFSKIPYTMVWGGGPQLITRGFSQSVPFFKPYEWMLTAPGCNDINIATRTEKISFIEAWNQAPSIELGMLSAFYPPFSPLTSDPRNVANWAKENMPPLAIQNLRRYSIFNKPGSNVIQDVIEYSGDCIEKIIDHYNKN